MRWFPISFAALCFTTATAANAAPRKDLARLAILTFEDQTDTKNYGYLPGSLTEAVDKSLQQKFEYLREEPAKSEAAWRDEGIQGIMDAAQAAAFANKNHFDIVIYGYFTLDRATKEIAVTTYVSLGSTAKFRRLKERKNPADATIFSLAEKVADDIVREMTEIARAQGSEEKPDAGNGKLELRKDGVTSWDEKKWYFAAEGGVAGPLSNSTGLKDGIGITVRIARQFWHRAYWGIDAGYAFTNSTRDSCGGSICDPGGLDFDALYGSGVLGYAFYPGNRWRIFADIGAGSAIGGFRVNPSAGKEEQVRFLFRGAVGVDFLIFSFLSFGAGIRVTTFPGSGESYGFGQPAVRIAFTF